MQDFTLGLVACTRPAHTIAYSPYEEFWLGFSICTSTWQMVVYKIKQVSNLEKMPSIPAEVWLDRVRIPEIENRNENVAS